MLDPELENRTCGVRTDLVTGVPKIIFLTAPEVHEALLETVAVLLMLFILFLKVLHLN